MDSFVVLPTASLNSSTGFSSTRSESARLHPSSIQSVVETDPRGSCVDAAPGRLQLDSVGLRQPADTSAAVGVRTAVDRAEMLSMRQRVAWKQMNDRMERRHREWNEQVDRMRSDFFRLKPPTMTTKSTDDDDDNDVSQSSEVVASDRPDHHRTPRIVHVQPSFVPTTVTRQQFQASFDLSDYTADEIRVQTDGRRLIVSARHERMEANENSTFSRQFTRQVDIPRYVDASRLRCTLSEEGVLCIEADALACSSSAFQRTVSDRPPPARFPLTSARSVPQSAAAAPTHPTSAPVILQADGTCVFRVSVPLGAEFEADQLTVKTVDRRLIVAAQRDETGPGRRAACREFNHEFDLPNSVDPETVTAHVTDDGQLVVEAPLF